MLEGVDVYSRLIRRFFDTPFVFRVTGLLGAFLALIFISTSLIPSYMSMSTYYLSHFYLLAVPNLLVNQVEGLAQMPYLTFADKVAILYQPIYEIVTFLILVVVLILTCISRAPLTRAILRVLPGFLGSIVYFAALSASSRLTRDGMNPIWVFFEYQSNSLTWSTTLLSFAVVALGLVGFLEIGIIVKQKNQKEQSR